MANIEITYGKQAIQGGVDLQLTNLPNGVRVNYGDYTKLNGTGGLVRRSTVTFDVLYLKPQYTYNADNSITVNVDVSVTNFVRTDVGPDDYSLNAHVTARLGEETIWNFIEPVIHASNHPGVVRSLSVTVPPLQSSTGIALHFLNDMENTTIDDELYIGALLFNPNPPRYIPMKGKHGSYKSFNDHMLEGEKGGAYHTIWNYFGDDAKSNGHGKKNNKQIRLEKE